MSHATQVQVEGVHFLTQSPVRVRLLELLYEEGPHRTRTLKDRLAASRVTVRRNIDALEERDWIETNDRECEITSLGELIVETVTPALETVALVERLRPFVRWFPDDELAFDVRALDDAELVVGDSSNPYAPVNRHLELMQSTNRFRCLLPAIALQPITVARDCVVDGEQEQEIVIGPTVAATFRTESPYRDVASDLVKADNCELFVATADPQYYLGLTADCIQIGVGDDDGIPRALVETATDEVREWATQTYGAYRAEAGPFDQ